VSARGQEAFACEVRFGQAAACEAKPSSNTYFITTSTDGGQPLLQSKRSASLFLTTLLSYRDNQKFELHEFVITPNHVHLLLTPGEGITIEKAMQFVSGFSFRARRGLGIAAEI
jgi:putative transposase